MILRQAGQLREEIDLVDPADGGGSGLSQRLKAMCCRDRCVPMVRQCPSGRFRPATLRCRVLLRWMSFFSPDVSAGTASARRFVVPER